MSLPAQFSRGVGQRRRVLAKQELMARSMHGHVKLNSLTGSQDAILRLWSTLEKRMTLEERAAPT